MIDLDDLKAFNDRFGREAGDGARTAVVAAVRSKLRRDADQLSRLGREEFGVILSAHNPAGALAFAESIRLAVRRVAI